MCLCHWRLNGLSSFYRGKKILVTGAGGFIGSHLCEVLVERGAKVTALLKYSSQSHWGNLEFLSPEKKAELNVVQGNIEDSDYVTRIADEQEIIFHLAALIAIPYSYLAARSYVRTNIEGTLNILEAARIHKTQRVIHTSTSETYGTALYSPIDERHPLQGQSPYSASKIGADKIVESYHLSFGLPVSTVRPFNTFGPRQSARAIVPTIISQALTQNQIRLGRLDPIRDMNFVKDSVEGFLSVAESPDTVGKTLNLASGEGITVGEMAQKVLKLLNLDKPIVEDSQRVRPEGSEVFKLIGNHDLAFQLAGWKPRHTFDEGLRLTVDFIKANLSLFKPDRYTL
jgi:NAD dependent epimerase/dehydratase